LWRQGANVPLNYGKLKICRHNLCHSSRSRPRLSMHDARPQSRLLRRQFLLLALLISGYAGFYLCRSNFSTTLPLLQEYLVAQGFEASDAKERLGLLASLGTLAYAMGKFFSGRLADRIGGRRAFLGGMFGSVLFTLLFAVGGTFPWFTAAWFGNRLVQSIGWPGLVKLCGRWFSFARYGAVMGLVSLSFLFGDSAARLFLGWMIAWGLSWSGVFLASSAGLSSLLVLCWLGLRETPAELGLPEPPTHASTVYGDGVGPAELETWRTLLGPLLRSRSFGYICLLSLGCTLLREAFTTWSPTYFAEATDLLPAQAATASALFPFCGGVSVLAVGFGSDRFGPRGRAVVIVAGLTLCGIALFIMGSAFHGDSAVASILLVGLVALFLIGPYSYLAGALCLDLGGKRGAATACGIIDGVGYLGAVLAGAPVRRLSVTLGWRGVFCVLAGVALLSALVGFLFWIEQRRLSFTVHPCKSPTS
jgi:OPA family glycerol-3-phosphate transporter-like MFS transporter